MNTLQGYQTRVSTIRRQVKIIFTSSPFSKFSTNAPGGLNMFYALLFLAGSRSDGDCAVHPEHPGGAGRGCSLHLHQPGFNSKDI